MHKHHHLHLLPHHHVDDHVQRGKYFVVFSIAAAAGARHVPGLPGFFRFSGCILAAAANSGPPVGHVVGREVLLPLQVEANAYS